MFTELETIVNNGNKIKSNEDIQKIQQLAINLIKSVDNMTDYDNVRVKLLGKKGLIPPMMKGIASIESIDEKKSYSTMLNQLKNDLNAVLEEQKIVMNDLVIQKQLQETIDITLPANVKTPGNTHPLTKTRYEVMDILTGFGFEYTEGNDIENSWHNFSALNIPANHPARQEHDTFYMPSNPNLVSDIEKQEQQQVLDIIERQSAYEKTHGNAIKQDELEYVLRTHTSPVQIRSMMTKDKPLQVFTIGRTYRADSDATHTPMFHQIEGLYIGKNVTFANLKWMINRFCERVFELDEVHMQFRPSYFPFTTPSAEVDIKYHKKGNDLIVGEGDKWLEILGCGMVHKNVLINCGIDPEEYQGFAFGIGLERLAMLKYGIGDLRMFYENDLRWLSHYGFNIWNTINNRGGI